MIDFYKRRSRHLLLTTAVLALCPFAARADYSFTDVGTLADESSAFGVSGDGSVVVGESNNGGYTAVVWTPLGGMVGLDSLLGVSGTCPSSATGVSQDGHVIVGYSGGGSAPDSDAVRWVDGTIEALGNSYSGFDSFAQAVNRDGSIIAGYRDTGSVYEAFIWDEGSGNMQALTGLSGIESYAYAITPDGSIVGGSSDVSGNQTAMIWSQASGVRSLGTIGSAVGDSAVYALSADGNAATGYSFNGVNNEAFRWEDGHGMTGLGSISGSGTSYGEAISADGTIIAGMSIDGGVRTAFRWTPSLGMESLANILTAHGVSLTGWTLNQSGGITPDGKTIVGTGSYNGLDRAFLMTTDALITPEELAISLAPVGASGAQAQGQFAQYLNQLMFTARNLLSTYFSHGGSRVGSLPRRYAANEASSMTDASSAAPNGGAGQFAFYATGSAGFGKQDGYSEAGLDGTTGILLNAGNGLAFGVGVIGAHAEQDTHLGGEARSNSVGGSFIAAFEPASGLRLYGSAALAHLNVSSHRNYLNGGAVDASEGSTDGFGYALAVRGGYEFPLSSDLSAMPYGELEWDKTQLDGYTETGGGIPAGVGKQSNHRFLSRLGGELTARIADGFTARAHAAWGHRLSGDDASVFVTAMSISQSIQSGSGRSDWAELGTSASYNVSDAVTLSAAVDTRFAGSSDAQANLTLGLVYRLN